MGEGEGKNDVTDQIEDEEQLLGLKGDEEPDKDQAQEAKELGMCAAVKRIVVYCTGLLFREVGLFLDAGSRLY